MDQPQSASPRFQVLDGLRGICAILVAMHHLAATAHVYTAPIVRNAFLFVDFFFVLSGFVITHAYAGRLNSLKDMTVFAIRRFGRVWPLHIAVLAAFVIAEVLNLGLATALNFRTGHPPFDPEGYRPLTAIPIHVLLLQAVHVTDRLTWNFPSWSISAEFWTYLIFGTICVLFPVRRSIALTIAGLLAIAIIVLFSPRGINVHYDFGLLRAIYGFVIGHLAYRLYRTRDVGRLPFNTAIELAVTIAVLALVWLAGDASWSVLLPLTFGIAVLAFSFERGIISRVLATRPVQFLGLWSYSIYMVHVFVVMLIMLATTLLQKLVGRPFFAEFVNPDANQTYRVITNVSPYLLDFLFAVYGFVTIALAAVTYRFVEVPGRRFFNQISEMVAHRAVGPDDRSAKVAQSGAMDLATRPAPEG